MILKEYINFEKHIEHKFISVTQYETNSRENIKINIQSETNLSIFINIGNMINISSNNLSILLPPKNAYLFRNESFDIMANTGKFLKYTIIEFKDELNTFLNDNINLSIQPQYNHIFLNNKFNFDFPLNIDILTIIEELYKIDYLDHKLFSNLEIKAKSLYLIFHILKKILFMDYKYTEQVSTIYTKYYATLKNIFDNAMTLDNSLFLYKIDKNSFLEIFKSFTDNFNIYDFIDRYLEYEQL